MPSRKSRQFVYFLVFVLSLFAALGPSATATPALNVLTINGPSGGDDGPIIQKQINAAIMAGYSAVYLKAGTYNLKSLFTIPSTGQQAHLVLNGGKDVYLIGASPGSVTLKFWNPGNSGLLVNQTRNFNLQNVILDYGPSPYGQGTVVSVDRVNNNVWVRNDSGYPTWDSSLFSLYDSKGQQDTTVYLTRTRRGQTPPHCDLLTGGWTGNWGYMNGLNWFHYQDLSSCPDGIEAGQRVILNSNRYYSSAIHLQKVQGAVLQNSRIYRSPGLTVFIDHTSAGDAPYFNQVLLDNILIMYSPEASESNREISTNADGVHISGSRTPVNITNSTFYGIADNAIDAHVGTAFVYSLYMSGQTPILRYTPTGQFEPFKVGDWVSIYNPARVALDCGANVVSSPYTMPGDPYAYYVNLSSQAAGCKISEGLVLTSQGTAKNLNTAELVADVNEGGGSGVLTVSGNQFYGIRGAAFLNHWWNSVITYNTFGSKVYGGPAAGQGIREGFCSYDLGYAMGLFVIPGIDHQQVYGNSGLFGDEVVPCNVPSI